MSAVGATYGRRDAALRQAMKAELAQRLAAGTLVTVTLPNNSLYYIEPQHLEQPMPRLDNRLKILSPFDNAVIQRKRLIDLFAFDYQLECYVPAPKRRYGYLALPLLYKDNFVGRMDCKAHRADKVLEIKGLFFESGHDTPEVHAALDKALPDFAGFQGCFLSSDSSWRGRVGYREVDPFFRSSGAQSKRYDFSQHSSPSIWPNLGLQGTARQASLFDVYSDVALGNQSISPTLMPIAPLFDNVLPYGIATPNRRGAELALEKSWNTARLKLDLAWFEELTGQGTAELRSFEMAGFGFEWTPTYGMDREFRLSVYEQLQHTNRGGSDLESVELITSNLTVSAQAELWPRCWVECSGRHAIGKGHEFLNVRSELGELFNFERVDLNTQAWMTSLGVKHGLSEEVVARLQWNFWGQHIEFDNQRRLLASQVFVVISATL